MTEENPKKFTDYYTEDSLLFQKNDDNNTYFDTDSEFVLISGKKYKFRKIKENLTFKQIEDLVNKLNKKININNGNINDNNVEINKFIINYKNIGIKEGIKILGFKKINKVNLFITQGDITNFFSETNNPNENAIVNAANEPCTGGIGIDGAINTATNGKLLKDVISQLNMINGKRCETGGVRIVSTMFRNNNQNESYDNLNASTIIQAVGPDYIKYNNKKNIFLQILKITYQDIFDNLNKQINTLGKKYINVKEENKNKVKEIKNIIIPIISGGIYKGNLDLESVIKTGYNKINEECENFEREINVFYNMFTNDEEIIGKTLMQLKVDIIEFRIDNIPINDYGDSYINNNELKKPKKIIKKENDNSKDFYTMHDEEINTPSKSKTRIYSPDVIVDNIQAGGWNWNNFENLYNNSYPKLKPDYINIDINKYFNEHFYNDEDSKETKLNKYVDKLNELLKEITEKLNEKYDKNNNFTDVEPAAFKTDTSGFIYKMNLKDNDKVILFGDFHGSYHTFFRHMMRFKVLGIIGEEDFKIKEGYKIVFCGDVIDRGFYSLEILLFIFLLIKNNPNDIIYNRGNHESPDIYSRYGFSSELELKLDEDNTDNEDNSDKFLDNFVKFLKYCPSAVILNYSDRKIWCCHGCIPAFDKLNKLIPKDNNEDIIKELKKFIENDKDIIFNKKSNILYKQIRWNDIKYNSREISEGDRGDSDTRIIGNIPLKTMLITLKIDFLIRGHQDKFANTVITKNSEEINFINPMDYFNERIQNFYKDNLIDSLGIDIQEYYNKLSNYSSKLGHFNGITNPIGKIIIDKNNSESSKNKLILDNSYIKEEKKRKDNNIKEVEQDTLAITISNNTDINRTLSRDSFVVVYK